MLVENENIKLKSTVAALFSEVLGGISVGVDDDFFLLGGHSLAATQVASRIREQFGVEVPVSVLFARPTAAALADYLSGLETAVSPQPHFLSDRSQPLPLSFAQQRLWFLHHLQSPELPAYTLLSAYHLDGFLDIRALHEALNRVVARHESLRTTFTAVNGRPQQHIAPSLSLPLPLIDLSGTPAAEQTQQTRTLALKEAQRSFDLESGPLVRVTLIRQAEDRHVLLVAMHHIISDGWSEGVFARELALFYRQITRGTAVSLPVLTWQYADYTLWQRAHLQGDTLNKQLAYWRQQLGGKLPVLELPTDYPRTAVPSFRGGRVRLHIPAGIADRLNRLSREQGCTLYMTLLAAFNVLLHRYSSQNDILVGSPIANRRRAETESLIGFFVNTLVIRTQFDGDPTFLALLKQVKATTLAAYDHQDVPFEKLVELLQPERQLSTNPLFQVVFSLQDVPFTVPDMGDVSLRHEEIDNGTAKFDLTLLMESAADGLMGIFEYNSDIFEEATIRRMVSHWQMLLAAIVQNPALPVSRLPLLPEDERQQVLFGWNEAGRVFPVPGCIHTLVEEWAERTPEKTAVSFNNQHLTYHQLNERANILAHYLQTKGVGSDVLVGLYLERSLEMVVAILGVLKAGGAYVPMDVAYPAERVAFMLDDAQMVVLLTQSDLHDRLPETGIPTICLDRDWPMLETAVPRNTYNPVNSVMPHHLAYVIYTSGSTGRPKGVLVTHENVVRLFTATDEWYHFDENDVWTLFHSYAFDFSVWEIWGALCYGGRLVVVPYLVSRSPVDFYRLLVAEGVTVLNQTPSAFRQLMRAEETVGTDPDLALRLVIFGGEALELQSLQPWFSRHGDERPLLVNMYGITETTVHVTYRPIRQHDLQAAAGSVIGRAIPDLQLYILDAHQQPVPIGVTGEIYVGGAGVTRGYLNRPELTEQRFVPDPFLPGNCRKLYRSGDLARWLPNGDVEYRGRIDHQVKIRGFRIELGEIEARLASHPAVREVLVMAVESAAAEENAGEKRLVAYVVCSDYVPPVAELRQYLRETLPEYMLPAAFVFLDQFPLTTNGKIDRRALPAPTGERDERYQTFVPPQTPTEQDLATVWAEVLGIDRVGIHDNFFDLGGDSILSIQVLAAAQAKGYHLTLAELFQHQTIAELASVVKVAVGVADTAVTPSAAVSGSFSLVSETDRQTMPPDVEDAYPLSELQAGMIFHSEYDPESSVYLNVTTMKITAPFDAQAMETAVSQLIARHPILRTSFDLHSYSQPLQLVHKSVTLPLYLADWRSHTPVEQETLLADWLQQERTRKFQWQLAPLIRFYVHRLTDDTFQFAYAEHHAILDGWSVAAMTAELFKLYDAALHNKPLPTDRTGTSAFRDFIALEQRVLHDAAQKAFWQQALAGSTVTRVSAWPMSAQDKKQQPHTTAEFVLDLPNEQVTAVNNFARRAGVSLKQALLAAHIAMLRTLSGDRDVLTGLVSNGRLEQTGGDKTLGLFLNTLPFRLQIGQQNWLTLAQETARQEQAILPYRRFPLPEIQRLHGSESLITTAFNFVHFHVMHDALTETGITLLDEQVYGSTNFDFAVNFAMMPESGTLRLAIEYNTAVYPPEQIETIANYYQQTLQNMSHQPEQMVTDCSPISEKERLRLLYQWQGKKVPAAGLVHDLFAKQATATPTAVAVRYYDRELTYDQLNRRANQLAHYLQAQGIGPEKRTAVFIERSLDMAVAALAVLKAGGAYLPVDTTYPPERVAYMLADADVTLVLTHMETAQKLPGIAAPIVALDMVWPEVDAYPDNNPETAVQPENAAYIIYTSGSTGKPKGVIVTHRGLPNLAQVQRRGFAITPESRVLQFAAFGFDASVSEMFVTWLSGAALILADAADLLPGAGLRQLIASQQVSVITLPPSALAVMEPKEYPSLKSVISAGEACAPEVVARWANGRYFVNGYGPTEATVCTTLAVLQGDTAESPPIGRPIDNFEVYVLNDTMQLVPIGVPGELYIGGIGLARGYHNRPALTAEKFVPHPFSAEPGARLYRTGDLVAYRPDGQLAFLGRIDNQVKLRGYRIELGEIEAVLSRHEAVVQTAVLLREDVPGSPRLVAYVVARYPVTPLILRHYLEAQLPYYMVPAHFEFLASMPLTPNGKIDRRALPKPDYGRMGGERPFTAPRNPTEKVLAGIFADVLHVPRVSIYDNFFDLGGHSLLAIQLASRIRATLRTELPLVMLFDLPTVAELAEAVMKQQNVMPARQIQPEKREGLLPLSFGQKRLWFVQQLALEAPVFNVPMALRLSGPLDVTALTRSCQEIVNRHEVLRAVFTAVDGVPYQQIQPYQMVSLPLLDLSLLSDSAQETAVAAQMQAEFERPFNLETGPVVRFKLLRLAPEEHIFIATIHHIVFDGWSVGVLLQELAVLYDAYRQGKTAVLPPLPVQYTDYAHWQQTWLDDARLKKLAAYWRTQIPVTPPLLSLPTDHPRQVKRSYRGDVVRFKLTPTLSNRLKALGQRTGTTLFMTLLAAFQTLLHRYSGQNDILVGSPTANRIPAEVEGLIGFFVNTLVLRANFEDAPTFLDVLRQMRQTTLSAYDHQAMPYEKLVEMLNPARQQGQDALFQVMFVLQNADEMVAQLGDLEVAPLPAELSVAENELTLSMAEEEGCLTGHLVYATDLFERETIERLAGHFQMLLQDIAAFPEKRVDSLNLLPVHERYLLLEEWAYGRIRDWPTPDTPFVHHLFSDTARAQPTAVAIQTDEESWTYAELESRSNQLAYYLRRLGVGPDSVVAVYQNRTARIVLTMLAVFKAGGIFLPLDPALPPERIDYMLADSETAVVVCSKSLEANLPPLNVPFVSVDDAEAEKAWHTLPVHAPDTALNPENGAYLIYTSGSTGIPKGVLVAHQAYCRHVVQMAHLYKITADDKLLQFFSFSFDPALEQVMMALTRGAALYLRGDELWNPQELYQRVEKHGITVMALPTAYWHQLAWAWEKMPGQNGRFPLRLVDIGGELMSLDALRRWQAIQPPHVVLHNVYGPTETTISATLLQITHDTQLAANSIGYPVTGKHVYILDGRMEPVPIGVFGELYIGGDGLARGYWKRPSQTAAAFIPDPFAKEPGARLYRTGDLARWLPNGQIEFLGRVDHQVKIRGYRIELGEIEAHLIQHKAVHTALVQAVDDGTQDKRLVAYVVPKKGHSSADLPVLLRHALQQNLPAYMVPAAVVVLDALPMTPSGKVDRLALPVPEEWGRTAVSEYIPPRNKSEKQLAAIWEDVLGVKPIGVYDNYFDLGGHSLLAVQLFDQIQKRMGADLPLTLLFETPTIAGLAEHISQKTPSNSGILVPIQPEGSELPFFCVHGGAGHTFHFYELAKLLGKKRPFLGIQPLMDKSGTKAVHLTVEEMAAYYVQEIMKVQPEGPYYIGGFCFGGVIAYEMARQLQAIGQDIALLALLDPSVPMNVPGVDVVVAQSAVKQAETLAERAGRHRQNMAERGLAGKTRYVQNSLKNRWSMFRNEAKISWRHKINTGKGLYIRLLLALGRPIPRALRDLYYTDYVTQPALEKYHPGRYSGQVLLLRAEHENYSDLTAGFRQIVDGELVLLTLPGTHLGVLKQPIVRQMATYLQEAFEKKREENGDSAG